MKKLLVIVMVVLAMAVSGCGEKKELRNYFFTNMETGEQLHGITQDEFEKCLNLYESWKMSQLQDYMNDLKEIEGVTVTWVDVS